MLLSSQITLFHSNWKNYYKLDYHQIWYIIIVKGWLPIPKERCGIPYYDSEADIECMGKFKASCPRYSHLLPPDEECVLYTPWKFRISHIFGGGKK